MAPQDRGITHKIKTDKTSEPSKPIAAYITRYTPKGTGTDE
jgi:hypothetical protein